MLKLLSESLHDETIRFSGTNRGGWSPDFVRGIAACIKGVEEIAFNEESRLTSFRTSPEQVRINVYYTTRTIGTALI